ncbi:PLD nuclease N-terminal domain-containing protein [Paenibacillus pini]|uniref:Cardiolipin synthase N-terminal domain-containing protein n=1 Tax=Paenibacillus pini JCM 16418 TaxID=1236976 RepID=W7YG71_9BACL|nr:PLD nuclease N-terminal domain-containing protein [Paenibacillus pini]GAF06543.1 hypothetical protein JCM16418_503 [Paenibacillus pini JCM 16418]
MYLATTNIDWSVLAPIILPLIIIQIILMIIAFVSLYKAEATRGPKWVWALIILFVNILGSVAYFVIGRKDA